MHSITSRCSAVDDERRSGLSNLEGRRSSEPQRWVTPRDPGSELAAADIGYESSCLGLGEWVGASSSPVETTAWAGDTREPALIAFSSASCQQAAPLFVTGPAGLR